jgi:hypothetical protein
MVAKLDNFPLFIVKRDAIFNNITICYSYIAMSKTKKIEKKFWIKLGFIKNYSIFVQQLVFYSNFRLKSNVLQ